MRNIDLNSVDDWQKNRQKLFRSVSARGKVIRYLGKRFFVYKNTFWPFQDSQPLVKNFRIQKGESVLDVGTGSGVVAIFACYKGAGQVVAVDINPWAIKSARRNAVEHGFGHVMTVLKGDLFSAVKKKRFNVITANLPFRNKPAHDVVARSQWDPGFMTNAKFLRQTGRHLTRNGRIYLAQANFGAVEEMRRLAKAAGFFVKKIGEQHTDGKGDEVFYAFLLERKEG